MPLQIWLPLTNGIENQGLADTNFTNNGVTVDNAGKIGKCYSFDGTNYIYSNNASISSQQLTLAAWVYPTTSNNSAHNILELSTGTGMGSSVNCVISYFGKYLGAGIGGNISYPASAEVTPNTWHHFCVTFNIDTMNYWLDGNLVAERTTDTLTSSAEIHIGQDGPHSNTRFQGKLNDIRVYDHILSPKEIKVLSQGLVAHYQLNTEWGLANIARTEVSYYYPTQYQAYRINLSENLVKGDTYTLQFWDVDISHTGKTESQLGIWVYWGGGSVSLFNWHGTSYFTNGHADYLSYTFVAPNSSSSSTDNPYLNLYNTTPNAEGTKYMHIGRWKLEKGSVATPWQPNSLDAEYATMGWGDNIIYDSSGYNNHGVNYSTTSVVDSPRNQVSTSFDGTTSYIEFPNLNFMPNMLPDEWSFSFWVYNKDAGDRSVFFSNYQLGGAGSVSFGFEKTTAELLRIVYNKGTFNKTIPDSTMPANTWTHFGVTKTKDHLVSVYRNGVLIDSYTNANCMSDGIVYRMGRDSRSDSTMFCGYLSDFRIYVTVLSAEDILTLYNTPVSVTNLGTMVTQGEFVEK